MGRSGTSYVASLLAGSGFHLGDDLKRADAQNEAGYYEDLETIRFHERWLSELGWDLGTVTDSFPVDPLPAMRAEIAALVAKREARGLPWAAKPPGALFFWPGWRAALPEQTVLLVPFRHPEAVARSYLAGGDTRERALGLWLQLNRLALGAIDSGPFQGFVLDFDHPELVARRLPEIIGRPVVDTYRPDLHHHRADEPLADSEIAEMYSELIRRAY